MRGVKSFLEERLPEMLDYISVVSTPTYEEPSQPPSEEAHVRNRAIRVLNERKRNMPELQRESIPPLPHFLDIPRHFAILTSAIARYSRDLSVPQDPVIADLCAQCRDIEQQALYRVSRHGAEGSVAYTFPPSERSPSPPLGNHSTSEDPRPLSPKKSSSRTPSSHSPPRTAPTGAASDLSLHHYIGSHPSREFPPSETNTVSAEMSAAEASKEGESGHMRKSQASRPRSASTDLTLQPDLGDAVPGRKQSFVDILRPLQNAERKKGFFRTILGSK
jgi:hypothetical protein